MNTFKKILKAFLTVISAAIAGFALSCGVIFSLDNLFNKEI